MTDLGKLLILLGGALILGGALLLLFGRLHLPLGRLPGDILYRGKNTTFYANFAQIPFRRNAGLSFWRLTSSLLTSSLESPVSGVLVFGGTSLPGQALGG